MAGKEEKELCEKIEQQSAKEEKLAEKTKEIVDIEFANRVLEDFLKLYKTMGNSISHTHFDKFLEILHNENVTFPQDETVDLFRTNLSEQLTESFQKMWNIHEIPASISILELLKERFKNRTIPQWRPQGKTPMEQTLPTRIHLLKKRRDFLIKQWDLQTPKLEAAVVEIATHRKLIEKLITQRDILSYRIDEQSEKLQTVQEKILDVQREAIKLL